MNSRNAYAWNYGERSHKLGVKSEAQWERAHERSALGRAKRDERGRTSAARMRSAMRAGRTSAMPEQSIMRAGAQAQREGEVQRERAHERSARVISNGSGAH